MATVSTFLFWFKPHSAQRLTIPWLSQLPFKTLTLLMPVTLTWPWRDTLGGSPNYLRWFQGYVMHKFFWEDLYLGREAHYSISRCSDHLVLYLPRLTLTMSIVIPWWPSLFERSLIKFLILGGRELVMCPSSANRWVPFMKLGMWTVLCTHSVTGAFGSGTKWSICSWGALRRPKLALFKIERPVWVSVPLQRVSPSEVVSPFSKWRSARLA